MSVDLKKTMNISIHFLIITFSSFSLYSQVEVSNLEYEVIILDEKSPVELICENPSLSIKFKMVGQIKELDQKNLVKINDRLIQISLFQIEHLKGKSDLNLEEQKAFLSEYTEYEIKYFINELNVQMQMPGHQWVEYDSGGWFIWYFRINNVPDNVEKKVSVQLFASKVIGDKLLTINAPIVEDEGFQETSLLIDALMQSFELVNID